MHLRSITLLAAAACVLTTGAPFVVAQSTPELAPHVGPLPQGTARVRVHLEPGQTLEQLLELLRSEVGDVRLLLERPGPFVDLALTPEEVARLGDLGQRCETLPAEAAANPTEYTFARMVSELQALEASHPSIARLTEHVSSTHEGRSIWEMKLSDNVALEEDEPTVFFVGVHHGGEMIGCDVLMFWVADTLAGYGTDPQKTSWLDDHEIRVIVIGNPDGWMNNETGLTSGWRKNKRDNNQSGQFEPSADGVDINRNFDFNWSLNGSGSPGSSIYRGPSPASEPEARLCQDLLLANKPIVAVSWHMSGEVIIIPWHWQGQGTPDRAAYLPFAQQVGNAIPTQNGGGTYFAYEEVNVGGYIDDWIYAATGGFCMTVEVSWSPSLVPITTVVANNQGTFPVVFERVAGPQVTGNVIDAVTGAPLDAKVEILEIDTSALPDRTSDAAFGRYRWLTTAGIYTLRFSKPGYHTRTVANVVVPEGAPTVLDVQLIPWASPYGVGLAGSGGEVPTLSLSGTPVIGSTVSLDVANALGGALAIYALGAAPDAQPFRGGTVYVAPPFQTFVATLGGAAGVPGAGSHSLVQEIPNDPSLSGITVYAQALAKDPGAPRNVALTAGLEVHVE